VVFTTSMPLLILGRGEQSSVSLFQRKDAQPLNDYLSSLLKRGFYHLLSIEPNIAPYGPREWA